MLTPSWLLVGGQTLGLCKAPRNDFDCNRHCIYKDWLKLAYNLIHRQAEESFIEMYCLLQHGDSNVQFEGNSNMMEICGIPPVVFSCGYWYYCRLGRSKMEILEFRPSSLHHWIIMNISPSELNRYFLPKWSHFWRAQTNLEMEKYRGREPLRSRAHDPQAAAGRGDRPAPLGLKRRKGTGYFLWKHTSEGIQKLPSVQPQVEPVQQTPPAYSNVTSRAVNRTLNAGLQPELSHPRRMETPLLPLTLPVERRLISSSLLQRLTFRRNSFLFPLSYAAMSPFIRRREVSREAEEQYRRVFPRHVGSNHGGLRDAGAELTSAGG